MSKPVLLSLGAGKVQELAGTNDNDVLTWDSATSEWKAEAGGGGSGTVTSVGLTGGTSGIVIGGTTSPITTSGTYSLDAPQRFAFDTASPIAPTSPGQISWNATEGSLNTLMAGGNVDAIVGQQLYQRAVNADTVTLTKGMVVYVFGSSGTRATVKRATADADLSSATILGVVAESIAQNAEGFIITNGLLKDLTVLPSTTFTDGDVVYLSPTTAGGLTPTKPTAPQHLVMVGYCVKASNGAAGVLLVHPQNGYELGELHDVYINSPTSGQILIYDATSGQTRWENASLTGTANQITVTPGAGSLTLSLPNTLNPTAASTAVAFTLQGGAGSGSGSAGAKLLLYGGAAGSGNANGGAVEIDGGAKAGSGSNGDVSIGTGFTTNRVLLGSQNVQTNVNGLFALADSTYSAILANLSDVVPLSSQLNSATITLTARYVAGLTGAGKNLSVTGGAANNANGNGGALSLLGGAKTGTGTNGAVNVGTSNTSAVTIGATGITTTVDGTLSLTNALAISSGGTNNGSLSVAQGTVYYGDGSKLVGLAPGTSGQFLQTQGAGANPQWASAATTTPYDLSGEFVGTPVASAVIMRFVAARAFTFGGTAYFVCTSNTGATTAVFTVNVNGVSKGTVSIAGNATSGTGTITSTSIAAGDLVSVVATTPANVINPYWTLPGTV